MKLFIQEFKKEFKQERKRMFLCLVYYIVITLIWVGYEYFIIGEITPDIFHSFIATALAVSLANIQLLVKKQVELTLQLENSQDLLKEAEETLVLQRELIDRHEKHRISLNEALKAQDRLIEVQDTILEELLSTKGETSRIEQTIH